MNYPAWQLKKADPAAETSLAYFPPCITIQVR